MINIDPETGDASGVALKVLAGYRRERSNILFGQFLALDPLSSRPAIPPPVSAASAASTRANEGTVVGTGGGGISSNGDGGGGKISAAQAQPAAEMDVEGTRRISGMNSDEVGRGANVSPGPPAIGGWKFWVSEGMEVAGEA